MMAQVLFFDIFFEKEPHLNAVERFLSISILNMLGLEYTRLVNMRILYVKIHGILNVVSPQYAKVLNISGV